jgi:hypothetical protein
MLCAFALVVAFGVTTCWVAALAEQQIQSPDPIVRCLYGDVLVPESTRFQMLIQETRPVVALDADSVVVVVACPNDETFIGLVVIRHYVAPPGTTQSSGSGTAVEEQPLYDGRLRR